MRILQIVAHPATSSFTLDLAAAYRAGAEKADNEVTWFNVYEEDAPGVQEIQRLVLEYDALCFAFPCWWEMPPAKLVELLQTVFVKGFAFDLNGDKMVPLIRKNADVIISMGQNKNYDSNNMSMAMEYCGIQPSFHVFSNIGPRLTEFEAKQNLLSANKIGYTAFKL